MNGTQEQSKSAQLFARAKAARKAEAAERHRQDAKTKIVLGGTAIAAMNADPVFREQFAALLAAFVPAHERKYVAEWLPPQSVTA